MAVVNLYWVDFMTAKVFYFVFSPKTGNVYLSSNSGRVTEGLFFLIVALEPSKI